MLQGSTVFKFVFSNTDFFPSLQLLLTDFTKYFINKTFQRYEN